MWTCPHCGGNTDDGFDICWSCRVPSRESSIHELAKQKIIVTTTPTLETHEIIEYFWPVFGEIVCGTSVLRDIAASFSDAFGGRSTDYENILQSGRAQAIQEMTARAERFGANAVVDLRVTYSSFNGSMFLICANGMAVSVRTKGESESITTQLSKNNPVHRTGDEML